jgi:hypothetical protein
MPVFTVTPTQAISFNIQEPIYDLNMLLLSGELHGAPKETITESNLVLFLFDTLDTKILEQTFPCADPPQNQDAICAFNIVIPNPPLNVSRYKIVAQVNSSDGLLIGEKSDLIAPTAKQSRFTINISMPKPTSNINSNLPIDVSIATFDNVAQVTSSPYEVCIYVSENRLYELSKMKEIKTTEECKELFFQSKDGKIAEIRTTFLFKPLGYGFVWNDSPEGRYKIMNIRAIAMLKRDNAILTVSSGDYVPLPVRVLEADLINGNQARARLKILAGQGETYNITLRVYQVEIDPDEVGGSAILLFLPCIVPGICDDRTEVGRVTESITLEEGKEVVITADYSSAPVSEEGNMVQGYSLTLFFEDIVLLSK